MQSIPQETILDREIVWGVDPRTISPHRGYIMSILAPPELKEDGTISCVAFGTMLFEAEEIQKLLENLVRRFAKTRGLFDMLRSAAPFRAPDERWRSARSIKDLLDDEEFSEYMQDRLIQYDRHFNRDPLVVDLMGQPSMGLMYCVLSTIEDMESHMADLYARMSLECWPAQTKIPKGYIEDTTFPPHPKHDMLVYCFRVYDLDRAIEILPAHYVQTFADEVIRRAAKRGTPIDDMVESGSKPTVFALSAAAEALARGFMKLQDVITFMKRRLADKRSQFLRVVANPTEIQPGLLLAVRTAYAEISRSDREFNEAELSEIALQSRIHTDPVKIAKIIHVLQPSVHNPTISETAIVRFGPLSMMKKEIII